MLCFASRRQKVQRTRPKNYFPRIWIDLQQNSSINRKGDFGLSSHPASNLHGKPGKLDSTIILTRWDGWSQKNTFFNTPASDTPGTAPENSRSSGYSWAGWQIFNRHWNLAGNLLVAKACWELWPILRSGWKKFNSSGWPDKLSLTVAGKRQDVTPRVRVLIN